MKGQQVKELKAERGKGKGEKVKSTLRQAQEPTVKSKK